MPGTDAPKIRDYGFCSRFGWARIWASGINSTTLG
jgi:hypothetical protein